MSEAELYALVEEIRARRLTWEEMMTVAAQLIILASRMRKEEGAQ